MKLCVLMLTFLSGCAYIDFDSKKDGLIYFEPKPYMFYTVTDKCVSSVSVTLLPGSMKKLKFNSGIVGSAMLSAELSNGVITKIGQTSDSKAPEILTSVAGLATAGALSTSSTSTCSPVAILYPLVDGKPNLNEPINLEINQH